MGVLIAIALLALIVVLTWRFWTGGHKHRQDAPPGLSNFAPSNDRPAPPSDIKE